MQRSFDKFFLLICSSVLYYFVFPEKTLILWTPTILVFLFCMIGTIFENTYLHLVLYFLFGVICCFFPLFLIFTPVMIYELEYTVFKWVSLFGILQFIIFGNAFSPIVIIFTALFLSVSILLYYKTSHLEFLRNDYDAFRATAKELTLVQEEKNQRILESQDYEIETATLNERNRISKEIHDHVGHLLSRSLIQIGALLTLCKEEPVREGLLDLKASISEGMDRVRDSIHNMHDESIDLEYSLHALVRNFTFCSASLSYQLHLTPSLKVRYCFIAITKEALSNIIKHGKEVTKVQIYLTEEDSFYHLVIFDDGIVSQKTTLSILKAQSRQEYPDGLGLQSISDRVKGFHGRFLISTDHGFQISIFIPKEDLTYESTID
ncbi:MAG: histidine kinase [Acetivibrio sp.]